MLGKEKKAEIAIVILMLNFLNFDHERSPLRSNDKFPITVDVQADLLIRLVKSSSNSDFMIFFLNFGLLLLLPNERGFASCVCMWVGRWKERREGDKATFLIFYSV